MPLTPLCPPKSECAALTVCVFVAHVVHNVSDRSAGIVDGTQLNRSDDQSWKKYSLLLE